MPRKPDPKLEQTIIDVALQLLEKHGVEAVTMREVAKSAGTTTPTLYERFRDRDALFEAITNVHRDRLMAMLASDDSLEKAGAKFLAYCRNCPNAVDLLLKRIASNLKNKKRGPMYEQVRTNLIKVHGLAAREAEELTLASSSMVFGTALLCSTLGAGSASMELERAMLKSMRRLVNSYQK